MQLPQSLNEFARVIGLAATLSLADCAQPNRRSTKNRAFRIRIPVNPLPEAHAIVLAVGREKADRLQKHFAGETMAFPSRRCRAITRDIRIAAEFVQGIPIPVLAEAHNVSQRTVTRALARVTTGDINGGGRAARGTLTGDHGLTESASAPRGVVGSNRFTPP